jgi:TatD DNase family protein
MIDTHAHLHLPHFDADRERVLARDFAMGVTGIVEVCIAREHWPLVARLAQADPRVVATAGIHPHEAARVTPDDLAALEPCYELPFVVAIGETGIDTYRDYAPLAAQQGLFRAQVGAARSTGLPLVVHCRAAFAEVFEILDREGGGNVRGVFHCFSGGPAEAREVFARGFLVGLGGAVTYDPARWGPLLRQAPLEAVLLETDCPYLKPDPDRGGRNEPAFVLRIAEVVAALMGIETERLIEAADRNAERLFGVRFPTATRSGERAR